MALGEAKAKTKREFSEVMDRVGYSMEQMHAYVDANPEMKRALYHFPEYEAEGIVSTAARFVTHASERMRAEGIEPTVTASTDDAAISAA